MLEVFMCVTSIPMPCLARHGVTSYKAAIQSLGGELLVVELDDHWAPLVMDAFDDVALPFGNWFLGGEAQLLQSSVARSRLPLILISGVTRPGGSVDPWLVAATSFMASLAEETPSFYRTLIREMGVQENSCGKFMHAAALNALDLACGDDASVIARVELVRGEKEKMTNEWSLFALQESCAEKTLWPGACLREIQSRLGVPAETVSRQGASSVWRLCVYQAAFLIAKQNGLLPLDSQTSAI